MSESSMDCSVCGNDFDIDSEGGVDGHFGMLAVSFCPTCYACMCDMADRREWEGLTDEERNTITRHHAYVDNIIKATEAKLKEKNGWTS